MKFGYVSYETRYIESEMSLSSNRIRARTKKRHPAENVVVSSDSQFKGRNKKTSVSCMDELNVTDFLSLALFTGRISDLLQNTSFLRLQQQKQQNL